MSLTNGALGLLGLGMGAANLTAQTYASKQAAEAENMAADINAASMERNALYGDMRAEQALTRGKADEAVARREGGLLIERQRASYAANGIKVDTGSALDVIAEQAGRNKYDQDVIRYNSEMEAWGHRIDADNLRQQAGITRATKRSPWAAAGATFLGGGTSLANQYSQYRILQTKG